MEFSGTITGLDQRLSGIEAKIDLLLKPHPEWIDSRAAAVHLSMTLAAFRQHLKRDPTLPRHRLGERSLRFRRSELDAWMEATDG